MKISIVTISFNQAEFLERCIRSVIEQDYDDVEYIIVDPGSTDGSRDIIEKYRNQISEVIFEPDDGPVDGLIKGFSKASGDIFAYLNSDDAYLPGVFKEVVNSFNSYQSMDVICGHGYIVDSAGNILRRFYSDKCTPWRYVHGGAIIMQQSTFFKRDAFLDVGGFNSENPIWWDGELLLDFAIAGKDIRVKNYFWSIFTMHGESISSQKGESSDRALKLDKQRQLTHARLYEKVMGHSFNKWTKIAMIVARIEKWVLNPVGTMYRVIEKTGLKFGKNRIVL
jgi:glycosyltransferase involved in cell wall biosynthesis